MEAGQNLPIRMHEKIQIIVRLPAPLASRGAVRVVPRPGSPAAPRGGLAKTRQVELVARRDLLDLAVEPVGGLQAPASQVIGHGAAD